MSVLVVSQGVPMILMGDENGRTQSGNNNAYCQDNELAWMDWSPEPREAAFRAFVAGALRLRARAAAARGAALAARRAGRRGRAAGGALAAAGRRGRCSEADWTNGLVKALAVALADADGRRGAGARRTPRSTRSTSCCPTRLGAAAGGCGSTAAAARSTRTTPPAAPGADVAVPARSMRLYSR